MHFLGKLAVISTIVGASGFVHADNIFAGVTWGETSNNIQKSSSLNNAHGNPDLDKVIKRSSTLGARVGMEDTYYRYYLSYENVSDNRHQYRLRQENLLGSYDGLLPVGDYGTKLFGGASAGVVKATQHSSGFSRDSDLGWAAGLQAGIIQDLGYNVSLEAGYRYLRTSADTRLQAHNGGPSGRMDLHSSQEVYAGLNYRF